MSAFSDHVNNLRYVSLPSAYAHSVIFQLLAETGIIGFSLFLIFICLVFSRVFREVFGQHRQIRHPAFGLALGIFALFLRACVDTDLQTLQLAALFWIGLGTLGGLCNGKGLSA